MTWSCDYWYDLSGVLLFRKKVFWLFQNRDADEISEMLQFELIYHLLIHVVIKKIDIYCYLWHHHVHPFFSIEPIPSETWPFLSSSLKYDSVPISTCLFALIMSGYVCTCPRIGWLAAKETSWYTALRTGISWAKVHLTYIINMVWPRLEFVGEDWPWAGQDRGI